MVVHQQQKLGQWFLQVAPFPVAVMVAAVWLDSLLHGPHLPPWGSNHLKR